MRKLILIQSEVASIDAHCENAAMDHLENGSVDTSYAKDDDSEQSWMLRSLSDSSVAKCYHPDGFTFSSPWRNADTRVAQVM
ncbi:hypothetical protein BVRB_5g116920 isoform A [Beta vulgaris subsp. vulgaris]|nr:hypothetical protein BVRB_5g116920 isoform A [Beta vulgaris subsp. vulgaris]